MSTRKFVMLPSYYEAIRPHDDAIRLEVWDAIMDFGMAGIEPQNLSPVAKSLFILVRPNIEKSVNKLEAQSINGSKGGRPPKQEPNKNPNETQSIPNKNRDSESDSDSDSDSESDRRRKQGGIWGGESGTPTQQEIVRETMRYDDSQSAHAEAVGLYLDWSENGFPEDWKEEIKRRFTFISL